MIEHEGVNPSIFPFSERTAMDIAGEVKYYPIGYFVKEGLRSSEEVLKRLEFIRELTQAEYSHYYRGVGVFRRMMQAESFTVGLPRDPEIPQGFIDSPIVTLLFPSEALPFHYDKVETAIRNQDRSTAKIFTAIKDSEHPFSGVVGFIETYHLYRIAL